MLNKRKTSHITKGIEAEQRAFDFLINKGLIPICRNFRCKAGEIDLIMEDHNTLVFVEVRYRKSDKFGSAAESITARKQARIIAATHVYLSKHKIDQPVRFDVIAISGYKPLNWIHNAFQASY